MIVLKSDAEIAAMRAAGRLSADLLDYIEDFVKPGVSTLELDELAHAYTIKHGGIPAPLNYKGFPKSICTSVNEVVCHGIPNAKQKLKDGDIIIDALLGTGTKGSLKKPFDSWVKAVNASGLPVVALDIPSGLDGDTGKICA